MGMFWFLKKRKALDVAKRLEEEDKEIETVSELKKEDSQFKKEEKELSRMLKHKKSLR